MYIYSQDLTYTVIRHYKLNVKFILNLLNCDLNEEAVEKLSLFSIEITQTKVNSILLKNCENRLLILNSFICSLNKKTTPTHTHKRPFEKVFCSFPRTKNNLFQK